MVDALSTVQCTVLCLTLLSVQVPSQDNCQLLWRPNTKGTELCLSLCPHLPSTVKFSRCSYLDT